MSVMTDHPVAVIGAGPVGLAAAAHLLEQGLKPIILEQGASVGSALLEWGHVRVFTPWAFIVDSAARKLLEPHRWSEPDPEQLPTGAEIVTGYLEPLAQVPEIAAALRLKTRVTAISRAGLDKVTTPDRAEHPFVLRVDTPDGERDILARAVIDVSGTWRQPNPMGTDGLPVAGERRSGRIAYGIPDVLGTDRVFYAGQRILVVGGGHSAINTILALLDLQRTEEKTEVFWALRRDNMARLLGGGLNDQLPARGALGLMARKAMDEGRLTVLAPFAATRLAEQADHLDVDAVLDGQPHQLAVDRIVVATGFRPDLSMLREVRIGIDPATEAPPALSPLIDPNLHSCGTVRPHGARQLAHPEPDFFIAGSKSYGRAPTFLMLTGYEQVRSIAAKLAGDDAAANDVRLVLPETGVCSGAGLAGAARSESSCCGGPAMDDPAACCVADSVARKTTGTGCGCGSAAAKPREAAGMTA